MSEVSGQEGVRGEQRARRAKMALTDRGSGSFLRNRLTSRRRIGLRSEIDAYAAVTDPVEIEAFQVRTFNEIWERCLTHVPFYKSWAAEHRAPSRIDSIADLRNFPVLRKDDVRGRQEEIFSGLDPALAYTTGGSTGEPTRYPKRRDESLGRYADVYTGRAWAGLSPGDSFLHIWGHAHLAGRSGVRRRVNGLRRELADWVANGHRVSAYDVSEEAVRSTYEQLVARDPVYIVGYTHVVFRLARAVVDNEWDVSSLCRLRCVVLTSETVTDEDVRLIEQAFGVDVAVEYGAAETGVIAASVGATWPLRVLWRSHALWVQPGSQALVVTTLRAKAFPLVNYEIGDLVKVEEGCRGSVLALSEVVGRARDTLHVRCRSGRALEMAPRVMIAIAKMLPGVTFVQFRQRPADAIDIILGAPGGLDLGQAKGFMVRALLQEFPAVDESSIGVELACEIRLTRAGKASMFVEEG